MKKSEFTDYEIPPLHSPSLLSLAAFVCLSAITLTFAACSNQGAGTGVGMQTADIVNGMTRDQIDWVLGPPNSTKANGGSSLAHYTAFYTVNGQPYQCTFKNNTLVNHGAAQPDSGSPAEMPSSDF